MERPLTPKQIVAELDKYIIGQDEAKRSVAIALRNRWRRQQVPKELQDEIAPKNIIMIGPTGIGKTEISRRLAKLAQAPFLKIEASKFTEVGYVGRDVESMIRDLTELAVNMVKREEEDSVIDKAREMAEERITLDELLEALNRGQILENYPVHRRGACCLLHGVTDTGRHLHVVCTTERPALIIITVYEPGPPKWVTPTERSSKP